MGEFFRGWRRNLGVVTLVMALVLMVGWIRSEVKGESLVIPLNKSTVYLQSYCGKLSAMQEVCQPRVRAVQYECRPLLSATDRHSFAFSSDEKWKWKNPLLRWSGIGFDFGKSLGYDGWGDGSPAPFQYVCTVPYWSLVIPLTLLSAYLLLSKPRKSIQKKITEPVPDEGA